MADNDMTDEEYKNIEHKAGDEMWNKEMSAQYYPMVLAILAVILLIILIDLSVNVSGEKLSNVPYYLRVTKDEKKKQDDAEKELTKLKQTFRATRLGSSIIKKESDEVDKSIIQSEGGNAEAINNSIPNLTFGNDESAIDLTVMNAGKNIYDDDYQQAKYTEYDD